MNEIKKRTLIEIAANIDRIFDLTLETDGEITPGIEAALNDVQGELAEKLNGIAYLCKIVLPSDADKLKQLEAAAKAKRQTIENKRKRILKYAGQYIELLDGGMKGKPFTIYQGSSTAIEIENISEIPGEYKKTIITETPDKTAIKNAIKEGAVIPGCRLVKRVDWRVR